MANKELVTQKSQLPALPDENTLREVFTANFEGVQPAFEAIKIPTGGGVAWSIPGEEEPEVAKELVGVVLDHYAARAFWPDTFSGGNLPPTCSSLNAKVGTLTRNADGEFGDCVSCKFSQWGTGKDERGQACKKIHRIYILVSGGMSIFPYLLALPPTSAEGKYEGSFSTYTVKLAGKLKKLTDVLTKVKLIQDKNRDGIAYSKAQFFQIGELSPEDKKMVAFMRDNLRTAMRSKPIEVDDYEEPREKNDPWEKS